MSWAIHRFADGDVKSSLPFYQFSHVSNFQKDSLPLPSPPVPPPSSSGSKISPAVLFIIVILAVIFFVSGLLHLLIRFLVKHQPSSSSSPQSNSRRYPRDFSGADALQRQLQQLFHLHDSGLDQAFIDALPVFLYRELVGPKEPFDCAVCLCEFADEDKLRLLPICSHAFHINCIDTWLLSNSTCPLCRGSLFIPDLAMENPVFDFDDARDADGVPADREDGLSLPAPKPSDLEEGGGGAANGADKMILPVRLGKFRSILGGVNDDVPAGNTGVFDSAIARNVSREEGESSSSGSSIDGRRCYSMGSYQYVVGDSVLRVALDSVGRNGDGWKSMRRGGIILNSGGDERLSGKRLCVGSKKESFSVSKIWQWSNKKGKFPIPADAASFDGSLPWMRRDGGGEGGIH